MVGGTGGRPNVKLGNSALQRRHTSTRHRIRVAQEAAQKETWTARRTDIKTSTLVNRNKENVNKCGFTSVALPRHLLVWVLASAHPACAYLHQNEKHEAEYAADRIDHMGTQ